METPTDRNAPETYPRPRSFSAVWTPILTVFRKLLGFFVLTDEEQVEAGIYLGERRP